MSLEQHNIRLEKRWKNFLTSQGITWATGQATSRDHFNIPYISLEMGVPILEGSDKDCWYNNVTDSMFRHFESELLHWLNGRDRIFWRTEPKLICEEVGEITGDIANREKVQDGLEAPRLATYLKKRYNIYCRLTAYRST